MELRHFRYFVAAAEALHFTRAAAQLGIATPTLTRQVQEMEEAMGVRLFARTQRSVALTPAGKVLLPEARAVLAHFDAAQVRARREGRGETGQVQVGHVASAIYSGALQRQVDAFRDRHPGIAVLSREVSMPDLPGQVLDGRLDVAYVRAPVELPPGLEAVALAPEPFVLALHAQSWLARLPQVTAAHLRDETFIPPEQNIGTQRTGERGGFEPRMLPPPGSLQAVLALVSLGQGVSVVPSPAQDCIRLPSLVFRPLPDCDATSHLALLSRRHEKSPATRNFMALARERARHGG
jgi:DNA-binding transcriptional LysR family regulator